MKNIKDARRTSSYAVQIRFQETFEIRKCIFERNTNLNYLINTGNLKWRNTRIAHSTFSSQIYALFCTVEPRSGLINLITWQIYLLRPRNDQICPIYHTIIGQNRKTFHYNCHWKKATLHFLLNFCCCH